MLNDQLDSGMLDQLDHTKGGAGNTRTISGSADLSFDHFELIGNQKVKDLLQISREICGLVGGTPDWISG